MPTSRNVLFLVIGALVVALAVVGYSLYQEKKEPQGVQINIGPKGLKIENNVSAIRPVFWVAGIAGTLAAATAVLAVEQVGREQDIVELRLGQKVQIDDGSCPAGQIKEVVGANLTSGGVTRVRQCVPRLGIKKK